MKLDEGLYANEIDDCDFNEYSGIPLYTNVNIKIYILIVNYVDAPNPLSKISSGTFSSIIRGTRVIMTPAQIPCKILPEIKNQKLFVN